MRKRKTRSHSTHPLTMLANDNVEIAHLKPVGIRPSFGAYLAQLWQRRHFIAADSRKRAASKYSNSKLGRVWFLLQPLLDAAFFWVLFGIILGISRGVDNFVAFIIIGTLMFQSSSRAITSGAGIIRGAKAMIRAFSFPRASIPLSAATREAVESIPTLLVVLVLIAAIPPHEMPGMTWLLLPVVWLMHMALNTGILLVTSRLGHILPDSQYILGFLSRILLYGSAIIFPIERFVNHPTLLLIVELNPIYQVINLYRTILMDLQVPDTWSWSVLAAWIVALVGGGIIFFWRGESSYGR